MANLQTLTGFHCLALEQGSQVEQPVRSEGDVSRALITALRSNAELTLSLVAPSSMLAARGAITEGDEAAATNAIANAIGCAGITDPVEQDALSTQLVRKVAWLEATAAAALDDAMWLAALRGERVVMAASLTAHVTF